MVCALATTMTCCLPPHSAFLRTIPHEKVAFLTSTKFPGRARLKVGIGAQKVSWKICASGGDGGGGPSLHEQGVRAGIEAKKSREEEENGVFSANGRISVQEREMEGGEVHLEMEKVDGVMRPKRVAFDYGFQAKFLRTGPSVPRNVIRLAFEYFGREWRVGISIFSASIFLVSLRDGQQLW
jgi:hypothetical protein